MSGIKWECDFIDALEAVHPNTPVVVGSKARGERTADQAGHLAHEWRAMQREAERLAEENANLHRIINKLTAGRVA